MSPRGTAVDLFAGTGSATAAFRQADWRVIELDLARPSVERWHTMTLISGRPQGPSRPDRIVADCRRLPLSPQLRGRVDFLWASPPCTEFSDADPRVDHAAKSPSLDLVWATMEAVSYLRPRYWILENVRGAIPFLGIPAQKIGPFCLWGYFPTIDPPLESASYRKETAGHSAAERARIPSHLSHAVHQAIERGMQLRSVLDLRPFRRHRGFGSGRQKTAAPAAAREQTAEGAPTPFHLHPCATSRPGASRAVSPSFVLRELPHSTGPVLYTRTQSASQLAPRELERQLARFQGLTST